MSDKQQETQTIHPEVMRVFGPRWVAAALAVADDLRSGVIPADQFRMKSCEACIGHYIGTRLGPDRGFDEAAAPVHVARDGNMHVKLGGLFAGSRPSVPALAAHAIETFVATTVADWRGR